MANQTTTPRARIEQAASENGWAVDQPSPVYAPIMLRYNKDGHYPIQVIYDIHGDLDDQVIVSVDEIIDELRKLRGCLE